MAVISDQVTSSFTVQNLTGHTCVHTVTRSGDQCGKPAAQGRSVAHGWLCEKHGQQVKFRRF